MPQQTPLLSLNAQGIAWAHTLCSISAFLAAFVVAVYLHYHKIVKNEHYGYPDEWFPSVSATIGDWYPERSIFQILIALTSGPRFLLIFLNFIKLYKSDSKIPQVALYSGLIRTITCGGWVYITSNDDHDWHDIFMISYIVLTLPWNYSITTLSPKTTKPLRKIVSYCFFGTLVPLVYLFIEHKVNHKPGSYSYYAYTEWGLIIFDIAFDSISIIDFKDLYIVIRPTESNDEFFTGNFNISLIKENNNVHNNNNTIELDSTEDIKFIPKSFEFNQSYFQIWVNLFNAFIFWSVFTALFVCVWFFPLWYMSISGYELVIGSIFSPILFKIHSVKSKFLEKPHIPRILTCLFGIGAYLIKNPIGRLFSVGIGSAFAFISLTNEIYLLGTTRSTSNIKSYSITFILGLTLSTIAKFAFYTNNPIWPIMNYKTGGFNGTGLILGVFFAYYTKIPSQLTPVTIKNDELKPNFFLTATGFGAYIFSILAMLTDSSTIIYWVWDGYPVNGPIPVPHGAISISVMCIGIYCGLLNYKPLKLTTLTGFIGAYLLYSFNGWLGYSGALAYIFWICFITPTVFEQVALLFDSIVPVMTLTVLTIIIFILMHVWVVAYAFVPGGPLLRERTDLVFGLSTLFTGLLVLNSKSFKFQENKIQQSIAKFGNYLVLFLLTSSIIAFNRFHFESPKPNHPDSRLVTAGIWTIHFGLDNDMWASEHRMRDLIKDAELDIVGLLESDNQRIIMGNKDVTQRIADELNFYADFGPGPNKHTWGAALLSKFPIIKSTHHLLPSPVGELAPAIHATLDMYGTLVDVVVFHSGQEEDEKDRFLQSIYLQMLMGSQEVRPMILLSYLVTTPLTGNYNNYSGKYSGMHDIDPTDDDRWCEYIMYKKLKRTGYARISRGSITDTELQVGKFVIPAPGEDFDVEYSQKRIPESAVPEDMRFPSMFYGEGVREHAFHVFTEPRYFR